MMDHLHHHHEAFALAGVDPLALAGFVAVMSFSALSSLHCALMCGPLVCAKLGGAKAKRRSGLWLYNLGRAVSYPLSGALVAGLGAGVMGQSALLSRVLAVALGVVLLAAAAGAVAGRASFLGRLAARGTRPLQPLLRRLRQLPDAAQSLALGFVTVLLPCMTLTPVLALAAAAGSAWRGGALLFAFFLGTLPAMTLAPSVPAAAVRRLPAGALRRAGSVFLLIAGFTTLLRVIH